MYVRVSVNLAQITGLFDYHLPPELAQAVKPGCLVVVPFGKQVVQGIVLEEIAEPEVAETRPVQSLLDPQPVLTPAQLKLARWMAESTLAPLPPCLDCMLPPGLSQQADTLYRLNPAPPAPVQPTPLQKRILTLLQERGALRGRQLETAFRHVDWKPAALGLVKQGALLSQPVLPPPSVHPRVTRTAQLACLPADAEAQMHALGRDDALTRRQAMLRFLMQEPWPVAVEWVYAASGGTLQDLYRLADLGLVVLGETEVWRDPLVGMDAQPVEAPPLTAAQKDVLAGVLAGLDGSLAGKAFQPILLHGVTGSGKTEIYLQAVEHTIGMGRQAIVLVPEISLTPQTLRRFVGRFPGQVGLVHSRLSPGERYDTWRRARAGLLKVIVGPRSALFAPLPNPGLIVVDECHDDSYYQGGTLPHYHAVNTALAYARQLGCLALLGSATPPVEMTWRADREGWNVLHLPQRILAHAGTVQGQMERLGLTAPGLEVEGLTATLPLPDVKVVDMREELKDGNRSIFSRALQQALKDCLETRQQAILFLNRRGSATYVFCRDCGYSLRCPRCDLPLTWHESEKSLLCHTCNYRRNMPATCPQCGGKNIRQFGTGTEKVESELRSLFPEAGVLRWDAGTARQHGAADLLMAHFSNHQADFLVGTQLVAKGLDLPLVTLVGVVLADVGLNFPDFRASERTFQLLTQVAGRAGRSPLGGGVVLQTFQPDAPAIQFASKHDVEGFTAYELKQRRRLGYPPFSRLVRMEYRHLKAASAAAAAENMGRQAQQWIAEGRHGETEIIGPVPCFFERVDGYYRWQVILRGPNPAAILRGRVFEKGWDVEVDPVNLL